MSRLALPLALAALLFAGTSYAQVGGPTPGGLQLGASVKPAEVEPAEQLRVVRPDAPAPRPVPTFEAGKQVVAIASAIGGEMHFIAARQATGTHFEPFNRVRIPMPDHTLDAIVMRGVDRVIARAMPGSERIFMRLNPVLLDNLPQHLREKTAFDRLLAEISSWPQRSQWDRIVIVTPTYRMSERNGLPSKIQGVGIYAQNFENSSDDGNGRYDVIEPDGTPGAKRRNRYVALYYYATMTVIDAKTLKVLEQQPWLIDEKIHDSKSDALNIADSLPIDVLSKRLETFAESASRRALAGTLGGVIEPGELRVVPNQQPAKPVR